MIKAFETERELGFTAASTLAKQLIQNEKSVIALPTGATPLPMYEALLELIRFGIVDVESAVFFNLDEYIGISPEDPMAYAFYMNKNLFSHVPKVFHRIPKADTDSPEQEAMMYENEIRKAGGFDLCFLGIGVDGHIGFNEPGTPFDSKTHVSDLDPSTVERNSKEFGRKVPKSAITVGLKTIMRSKHIILMATGEEKSAILKEALTGRVDPAVPASILQLHSNLTVLVDQKAGAGLQDQRQ